MDEIQQRALETWYEEGHELYGDLRPGTMGLAGEVGEFVDEVKKGYYKPGYPLDSETLVEELGDVLFYVSVLAAQLEVTLDEVSRLNSDKLREREVNGTGYNRGIDAKQEEPSQGKVVQQVWEADVPFGEGNYKAGERKAESEGGGVYAVREEG